MLHSLAEFLEREAGHIAVALLLIAVGYFLWVGKFEKGEDVVVFALGLLSRSMIGVKAGKGGEDGAGK
ncbi:MAG: hypothetical protein J0H49_10595 [Acidobacteria bacterium]|nr:hypothetical protein [Acidobacteriota bacterium]